MKWYNYFVTSKHSRLTEGHLPSENLLDKILNHSGETAYCCYFDLDYDKCKYEYDTGKVDSNGKKIYKYGDHGVENKTFTAYDQNIARPALDLVSFDFDDADNPQNSLDDVRLFIKFLEIDEYVLFFSGSKGFHLMVPFQYFGLAPTPELPYILRDLAKYLKDTFETLDASIYNYNRKFRVPFSKHEKTGLYKNTVNVNDTLENIKKQCAAPLKMDFTNINLNVDPSTKIQNLLSACQKKSYEVNTELSGSKTAPSPFERFDDKSCIKKMLSSRCDNIGRNNAALRIVNDFYRVGKTRAVCETALMKWAAECELPLSEISTIISNVYDRHADYNFGCQDECKSSYCTYKCPIYLKLDPDKRPEVMDMPTSVAEKIKKPKESDVVKRILSDMFKCSYDETKNEYTNDGDIVKQDNDLFVYKKGRWLHLGNRELDLIKTRIAKFFDGYATNRSIEQAFKYLLVHCPSVPVNVDMFVPNPYCSNFKNGTLHLVENRSGEFSLDFTEHNKLDYLTNIIEMDYRDNYPANKMFTEMLDNIFMDDDDKDAKINSLMEMFGASLMPNFPRLFYLWGVPGSGKSTLMKILMLLLGESDNICMVQPKHFGGFNMEHMAGKLVNMVTDIDTHTPIRDDVVKQIEDRVPILIARKFKSNIKAPMPAVHIFGANELVSSNDGNTSAFHRRWSVIKFNNRYTGKAMRNIDSRVFKSDPEGILGFAISGLKNIIKNQGYFTQFETSAADLKEWQLDSDVVGQFLEYSQDDEKPLIIHENCRVKRTVLWEKYSIWQDESLTIRERITRHNFYKLIRGKDYAECIIRGVSHFKGLGESIDASACDNISDASSDI